mgnify:CR=1 FL=1
MVYPVLSYIESKANIKYKKIDIKKLQFGSKIDAKEQKRDDLFTVKNVLCANKIELNIIDAGHFETENIICDFMSEYLQDCFPELNIYYSSAEPYLQQ